MEKRGASLMIMKNRLPQCALMKKALKMGCDAVGSAP
jgi:hypothetical protein